jgi:hypothetical protein
LSVRLLLRPFLRLYPSTFLCLPPLSLARANPPPPPDFPHHQQPSDSVERFEK